MVKLRRGKSALFPEFPERKGQLHCNAHLDKAVELLPENFGNILLYNTLTGLRPSEAVESIKLIRTDKDYINKELMVLEHFRHPVIFLRRTKKAYITLVLPAILEIANNCEVDDSWNALSCQLKRKGLGSHTKYCRAVFSTYLRKQGIEPELIDIFQGRVPKRPYLQDTISDLTYQDWKRMIRAIKSLHKTIASN